MKPIGNQPTRRLGVTLPHETIPECRMNASAMPLGPFERLLVGKIDGRRTIGDLAALFTITPLEVSTIVARLVELGVLSTVDGSVEELELEDVDEAWEVMEPPSSIPVPASRRATHPKSG